VSDLIFFSFNSKGGPQSELPLEFMTLRNIVALLIF